MKKQFLYIMLTFGWGGHFLEAQSPCTGRTGEEVLANGRINWSQCYLDVSGQAVINRQQFPNEAQAKLMATRGAEVVAKANLLEILKDQQLARVTTVSDLAEVRDEIGTRLEGTVRGARMINQRQVDNDLMEVTVRLPLEGSNLPAPTAVTPVPIDAGHPSGARVWAVIVGVGLYNTRYINELRFTDDDAFYLYAFLRAPEGGGLPEGQIRLLIDRFATRENILSHLQQVADLAGPEDVILLYFSGHGIPGALVPVDYQKTAASSLAYRDIFKVMGSSAAQRRLLLIDACHSGSVQDLQVPDPSKSGEIKLPASSGWTVSLASSKAEEVSFEIGGFQQGQLSYYLRQALTGQADQAAHKGNQDGWVDLDELFQYTIYNTKKSSFGKQNPQIIGSYDKQFRMARVR